MSCFASRTTGVYRKSYSKIDFLTKFLTKKGTHCSGGRKTENVARISRKKLK
jgi:hypothetical protein